MSDLEAAAEEWIAGHPGARHLIRTRDWLLQLESAASEASRVAALTHDVERRVPGGPSLDLRARGPDDAEYLRAHAERSAVMVERWLGEQGAPAQLRRRVGELVRAHEFGGWPEADLVQAADSLSFLEVNPHRVIAWVLEGRCDVARAQAKLDWMRDRISTSLPEARRLSEPLHARARAALANALSGGG